jgi:uroporphyrinogen III methyltransferase/synthase
MATGNVYLVGAGPGDPGLLTLRGLRCLQGAGVVVYDALVNPALLRHAPRAEHVFVGKQSDRHSLPQEEIQQLLIAYARRGLTVVRLKGGDPFVFGRGGEEALALAEADIPFEIVPGVTAGIAAPAYAGIPVTQRGLATSVTFITGHFAGESKTLDIDFQRLSPSGTLVFYMGVAALPEICKALVQHGWPDDTPCAVVEWATYARQRTVSGTLNDLPDAVNAAGIGAPSIIVVGPVAALRDQLAWFENRPLFGLRIAVTHTEQRKGPLEEQLASLGAGVFSFPTLEVEPETTPGVLLDAGRHDWIVLTSANAADMLFASLDHEGKDARALAGVRLCAVGASTMDALAARYLRADALPENYTSEAIVAAMMRVGNVKGASVLIPRADVGRASLAQALIDAGAVVDEAIAYHTRLPAASGALKEELLAYQPHLLVFTNAAAVRNLCEIFPPGDLATLRESASAASIGPVTSRAVGDAGFGVAVEPALHDVAHLVEAICDWWREQKD